MNYIEWNNLIGEHIYRPENEGRVISLIISESDIVNIGRNSGTFEDDSDSDILKNFKLMWSYGYPQTSGTIIRKIREESQIGDRRYRKGETIFNYQDLIVRYPPVLLHLIGVNLALVENSSSARYDCIISYFEIDKREFPAMSESVNWNNAWEKLVWWTNHFNQGAFGLLPEKSLSTTKYAYMGKPYTFILFSKGQLNNFYEYFYKQELEPGTQVSEKHLINAAMSAGLSRIKDTLKKNSENSDRKSAISILRELYNNWDGTLREEKTQTTTLYQSRKLRLCFIKSKRTGKAEFSFRFKEEVYYMEDIRFNGENIPILNNKWSSPIAVSVEFSPITYKDPSLGLKAIFKPKEEDVFLFANGRSEGLHSDIFLESDQLAFTGVQYLIFKKQLAGALVKWIDANDGQDITEDLMDNQLWYMFIFRKGFLNNFPGIDKLCLPEVKSLRLENGLKGNGRGEYISGYPLYGILIGAEGAEQLVLESTSNNTVIELAEGNIFEIPSSQLPGDYNLELEGSSDGVLVPNYGKFILTPLTSPSPDDQNFVEPVYPVSNPKTEVDNYENAFNLLKNMNYLPSLPPQFDIWVDEETNLENLDEFNKVALDFAAYISYKGVIRKDLLGDSLAAIYKRSFPEKEIPDLKKLISYTLSGLLASYRVIPGYDINGKIKHYRPVKPFLLKLGNFKNIQSGLESKIPFTGSIYAVGGIFSYGQLKAVGIICAHYHIQFRMYNEYDEHSLVMPSVFIYFEKDHKDALNEISNVFLQNKIEPYYRLISEILPAIEFLETMPRQSDLHEADRYQLFNTQTLTYTRNPLKLDAIYPSLSQYEMSPWDKVFILRYHSAEGKSYAYRVNPRIGKYLILMLEKRTNYFSFDDEKHILVVPLNLRLPTEMEKNLFFITGRLPAVKRLYETEGILTSDVPRDAFARNFLIYKGILKNSARHIAGALGQNLNTKSITLL